MKRFALPLALATVAMAGSAAPAAAVPVGECPTAFTLRAKSDFGPGFQDFLTERIDKNEDALVCAKVLPEALPFPNVNFVDNVVRP